MTLSAPPSMSVSLAVRLPAAITTAVSSLVVKASATATGASLTGLTVMLTVAVALPPLPSVTV